MQNYRYHLIILFAVSIASGCATTSENTSPPSLKEAHNRFNTARTNPDVTNLAPLELKTAEDTLKKADAALEDDEDEDVVNHLAYLAKQQVAVAEETAKQKAAELAIENANAKRTQAQLLVRTEEADAAKQALKELHARQTERGLMMTLSDVLFRTNKAKLESGGVRIVEKLADFLKQHMKYKVSIEGHTDSTAGDGYNQELSERRAEAVQLALIAMGVGSERVMAQGYGESFPVANNGTAAGRKLNRRVEIILSDEKGNIVPR